MNKLANIRIELEGMDTVGSKMENISTSSCMTEDDEAVNAAESSSSSYKNSQPLNFQQGNDEAGEGVYNEYMTEADGVVNAAESSRAKSSTLEKKLLHYTGKAIADYNMIQTGDRVMVCLSGGKDSFTMLTLLRILRKRSGRKFDIFAFTLDQAQPGWDDRALKAWLEEREINYEILSRDTYSIVKEKVPEGQTYCALCSRLRRGIIYRYAKENGFTKIALGHHRDDLIRTFLMSLFYNGDTRSMPPKLLSDDKSHIIIRPLSYCQESDIIKYAQKQAFPIIPCNLCGSQENLARKRIARLIDDLAKENPKIPSNLLHALSSIKPSQLMSHEFWNFKDLEKELIDAENL